MGILPFVFIGIWVRDPYTTVEEKKKKTLTRKAPRLWWPRTELQGSTSLPPARNRVIVQQHPRIQPNLCSALIISIPKSQLPTSTVTALHFILENLLQVKGWMRKHQYTWGAQCPATPLLSINHSRATLPYASTGGKAWGPLSHSTAQ